MLRETTEVFLAGFIYETDGSVVPYRERFKHEKEERRKKKEESIGFSSFAKPARPAGGAAEDEWVLGNRYYAMNNEQCKISNNQ